MTTIADQLRALRRHANDLSQRIIDACLGHDDAEGLIDELRDTLDRIDEMTKAMNGADE